MQVGARRSTSAQLTVTPARIIRFLRTWELPLENDFLKAFKPTHTCKMDCVVPLSDEYCINSDGRMHLGVLMRQRLTDEERYEQVLTLNGKDRLTHRSMGEKTVREDVDVFMAGNAE